MVTPACSTLPTGVDIPKPAPCLWLPAYTNLNASRDCVALGQLESEFPLIFLLGLAQISWQFSVCMSMANGR
jgi:hypothetical protein